MSKRTTLLTIALAAVIVLAGGVLASNMGFKIIYPLKAGGVPGVSHSGTHALGLPYIPREGLDTAKDLFLDIGRANVQMISRFLTSSDTYQVYSYGMSDFALVPGEGYMVKVGQDLDYVLMGSHDPAYAIPLISGYNPNSRSGTQLVALPYHATSTSANQLFLELGRANVQMISLFNTVTDTFQVYSYGMADFPLIPGHAYFIKMGADMMFIPSHY